MWIESTDDIDGLSSAESTSEKRESPAEKARSKKASQYIQKAQKDEKKAKVDNDDLFLILSRFFQNPLFDDLYPSIITLLELAFPSRVILWLITFIYPEAALYLADKLKNEHMIDVLRGLTRNTLPTPFDENSLDPSIRKWMNLWITSWYDFVLHYDASAVMNHKFYTLLDQEKTRHQLINTVVVVIVFFFQTRNIEISNSIARGYATFIVSQLHEKVKERTEKHIATDPEFYLDFSNKVDVNMLFGFGKDESK